MVQTDGIVSRSTLYRCTPLKMMHRELPADVPLIGRPSPVNPSVSGFVSPTWTGGITTPNTEAAVANIIAEDIAKAVFIIIVPPSAVLSTCS